MRPTPRLLLLFAAGLPVAALPTLFGAGALPVWLVWVSVCTLVGGVDALLCLSPRRLDVEVRVPRQLYVGDAGAARVTLCARARPAVTTVTLLCDLSEDLRPEPPRDVALEVGVPREVDVPLVPRRRGTCTLERLWLRWTGPLGLVVRQATIEEGLSLAVVPNIAAVRRTALRLAQERDITVGQRSVRFIGEGSEFDAMREYVPGLDHRSINWRATARHRKLICQDYRAERNHQVIVAFDTGHLMAEPIEGIPKLDHAIHAGLVLAYTSLRNGDRVGLYGFDARPGTFVAPRGRVRSFARIQHATAALDYSTAETNFTVGLAELATQLTRRSLVVLMTDFVDTVTAELMLENARRLVRRHVVVFVALRDPTLEATALAAPDTLDRLYRSVVASDLRRQRELVLRRLEHMGVFTIDAAPDDVSADLLNRYLSIKRRELV